MTLPEIAMVSFFAFLLGAGIAWMALRVQRIRPLEVRIDDLGKRTQELLEERGQLLERSERIPEFIATQAALEDARNLLLSQNAELRESLAAVSADLRAEKSGRSALDGSLREALMEIDQLKNSLSVTKVSEAQIKTQLEAEQLQLSEKLRLLSDAKESMSNEFKAVANAILEDKSKKFTESNRTNLDDLLKPFQVQLKDFRAKVEEVHLHDVAQQATLKSELNQLKELNKQITEEAHHLATALRGQKKTQGNWGELVLENVLERSGLRIDLDYRREVSFTTDEGKQRPDVIVYLPQNKHLIIDAKVSLNAYMRYVNSENDLDRENALREHTISISNRINELAARRYCDLPELNTPEWVFMFIPIESAFYEAARADDSLWDKAREQGILIATPLTLLPSLKIVRQLWHYEEQNAHTAELARQASGVYKKLAAFLESMKDVGDKLDKAKSSYGNAMSQLQSGKGNLIKRVENFRKLGVSVQRELPRAVVERANLELDYISDAEDEEAGIAMTPVVNGTESDAQEDEDLES